MTNAGVCFEIATAQRGSGAGATAPGGAIGVVHVCAPGAAALDAALGAIGVEPVAEGAARVRRIADIDDGLVARWGPTSATLMPHNAPAVLARIESALRAAGAAPAPGLSPAAGDEFEAHTLAALARARSPRAIDMLLAQPDRWREWASLRPDQRPDAAQTLRISARLDRLIDPPTVVALGATNIGKSTLLNALAREALAIVADEPGVTRDHVGALVDLDGLLVRWVDTPGLRPGAADAEREAVALALDAARGADLLVLCADPGEPFPDQISSAISGVGSIRVGLRADTGETPGAEAHVCALLPDDVRRLAGTLRRRLLSDDDLAWGGPWAFCDALRDRISHADA